MLQNRVDPFGNIFKTSARGVLTGTRGVIHDAKKEIIRPFKLKAWITCLLEFKGRQRIMMTPNRYTELFFFDEATSFSAGHRPCFECRRDDAKKFKTFWIKGNPEHGFSEKTSINEIDKIIHKERIDSNFKKVVYKTNTKDLPNGVFIMHNNNAYLLKDRSIFLWTPFGYEKTEETLNNNKVVLLTPMSVVNALKAGYKPQIAL